VARPDDPPFEIDRRIAEGGRRFRTGTADRAAQLFARLHESHAFATASGDGLDHHGIADAVRDRRDVGISDLRAEWLVRSRHDGHSGATCRLTRGRLAPHQCDRFRRRADEDQPGIVARAGERFVLGKKSVARVDGVGSRGACGIYQAVNAEITFGGRVGSNRNGFIGHANVQRGAIAVGVDGNRPEPEVATRPNDTNRDLTPVGDQDLAQTSDSTAGSAAYLGLADAWFEFVLSRFVVPLYALTT
jgi:hypothetical protein